MADTDYYTQHLEWEAIDFPLRMLKLSSSNGIFGFSEESVLILERNDDFKIVGKIIGFVSTPLKMLEHNFIGKGNIIKGEDLTGEDLNGNHILLGDCHLLTYHINSMNESTSTFLVEGKIIAEKLTVTFKNRLTAGVSKRFDWFVCAKTRANFWESTLRRSTPEKIKIRTGIDHATKVDGVMAGTSWAKDYVKIELAAFTFLIAKVPHKMIGNALNGLCFEFRDEGMFRIPEESIINQIENFVSFILGNQLTHIGYSLINNDCITQAVSFSCNSESIRSSNKIAMPPVTFNTKYEWGNFSWLVKTLLQEYLNKDTQLKLGQAISRYWVSKGLAIGLNIPILSNAVEIIAAEYLSAIGAFNTDIIADEVYTLLIKDEMEKLKVKILKFADGQIVLNNIAKSNKKSISVKMKTFFNQLGIEIGKEEKAAIQLRNKMAHSSRDYMGNEKAYDDVISSRIYEVLFNRIILKLLNYDGYYTDYSQLKSPLKHISQSAGNK